MEKCVKNCGQCPFFELFLKEYEPILDKEVGKGVCHKYNEDEVWETRASCNFANQMPVNELEELAFS